LQRRQVFVYGRENDVLICLSTSGGAKNVINAAKVGRAFGLKVVGFTGERESELEKYCDITIKVPNAKTYKVQEFHLPVYHTICLMLEQLVFE
ncbi:MAG: SIS domain-containing protein, partial [Armatimonadota bacterium]